MSAAADAILLAGRFLLSAMFLYSAIGHVRSGEARVQYARNAGMPLARLAAWPSGVVLAAGSLSIMAGLWPDAGALLLALFVAPASYYFHPFWTVADPSAREAQALSFWRNVTLVGACLALFAFFASAGHASDLTITSPLFDLR